MVIRFTGALGLAVGIAITLSTGNPLHAFWSLADDAFLVSVWLYKVSR